MWHFILQLVLWHRWQSCIDPTATIKVEFTSIEEIWPDSINVLSAIARVGQSRPDDIAYAFRSGVFRLPKAGNQAKADTQVACNFSQVKNSMERLRLASPKLKQAIVDACAHTVLPTQKQIC